MIIYKTTNLLTGVSYVGRDLYNNPKYLGSGTILKRAIRKYGSQNFSKEVLKECNSIIELNEAEIFFIRFYDTLHPNGYNIARGGSGGNTRLGYTEEQHITYRKNRSISVRAAYEKKNFAKNPFVDKTPEERKSLCKTWSDCKKGKLNGAAKYFDKIEQSTKEGVLVKLWTDIHEIRAANTTFNAKYILECCKHTPQYNTHRGFKWNFIKDEACGS